jgi:nitrate reductase gamma subunit
MMHTLYKFVSGPMVWLSFAIFLGGVVYRVWALYRIAMRKERFLFSYLSVKYSLRSLVHWFTPFSTMNMRMNPVLTLVSFVFHTCIIAVPLLLLSHIVLWEEAWGIQWWALPDKIADGLTLVVLLACLYFALRRVLQSNVRYVSTPMDYLFLILVAMPFATGFYCYHQWPGYGEMLILHMLSGEIVLAVVPFTRLGHMIYVLFTRSYIGSEFGAVRHVKDY